ncbi:N-6 DNA methylase [Bradyrhizobium diversitatis]|uniref:site-specific DNA-methyltransferase (adenine-specific) n=1 Tax=Bradyrhizobium diversitatis TaxID=2755406 RepID=A0ABS0P161_9BRAD|nr:N-6 DNA methylase [Bradyrhizobium diversitatis]MBH5386807.1 N-6 DNA methylase [Bradyrhizobium diversitatis]
MSRNNRTHELLVHLASRPGHDEVKADFRQLLIEEFGVELSSLDFERRVPEVKGRLDALIGRTVFEAKRNLDNEWDDVVRRMPDYLADREREEGERYVGIASDGFKWVVFERQGGALVKVKETTLDPDKRDGFLAWLDGAVALRSTLTPDPVTVRIELGQDSIAFRRANEQLSALWERWKNDPATKLKRQLWAQLLKLVYGREVESDALFFQHTFLVVVAKAIALAVLGLRDDDPKRVLSGAAFIAAGVYGAAESDFFDWIVADAEGENLVRRILTHVRRFRLQEVETDVLKILYESLIDRDERHGLGEYYTPDWLAAKITRRAVDRPLEQRVLDPACGSGTFLFHSIRNFLLEADDAGLDSRRRAEEATKHVAGMDIHPVAVIIARVTYLLGLAPVISARAGALSIPVYLGDALQLSTASIMGVTDLVISVPAPPEAAQLKFPEIFCKEIGLFDNLVGQMREGSEQGLKPNQVASAFTRIIEQYYKRDIDAEEKSAISEMVTTYVTFDDLRRQGRDSVWTYVARNLSRPLALAFGTGWANVVIGNPPWVAFRHMSSDLQKRFRELAKAERVYVGGKFATQNDLAALFTVRAAALYLRSGGRIAFVLPLAALTRGQFDLLRKGAFTSAKIIWEEAWTMNDGVQPLFPVPSCVVFGRRRATSQSMPETVRAYEGTLPLRDAPESVADEHLEVRDAVPRPSEGQFAGGSAYRSSFRQGATLVPRMLCFVERQTAGRLGGDPTAPFVRSRRSSQEKEPWKTLSGIEHRVEAEFLHPVLLGESILPFRVFRPFEAVVPVTHDGVVMDAQAAANRGFSGLHGYLSSAEAVWNANSESGGMTLIQRWNYHNELSSQFPQRPLRVIYAASGTIPAACLLRDPSSIIEHGIYWAPASSEGEGLFLAAILNSETARSRVADLQARGQWGARHFDKVVFNLPIPR